MTSQVVTDSLYLLARGMAGTILTMLILMGVTIILRILGTRTRNSPE